MESHAKYILVGSIVIGLAVTLVVAVLWLSEAKSYRNAQYYDIYFQEHTLYGLQQNSDVTMRGIKVGTVVSLEIVKGNVEKVRVRIMVPSGTPVKSDSEAQLNRSLLTGFASIDIGKGTQNAPLLEVVPPGETYPVIREGNTQLDQFANSLPELLDKAATLSDRAAALVSDENVESASKILKNVERITAAVADSSEDYKKIMQRAVVLSDKLEKASDAVRNLAAKGSEKIDNLSEAMLSGVNELRAAATEVNAHSGELIQTVIRSANVVAAELRSISQNVQVAADAASSTLETYEQPSRFLSGPSERSLGPGEEKRHGSSK